MPGPRGPDQVQHAEDQEAEGGERRQQDQRLFAEHAGYSNGGAPFGVQTFCYHEPVFIKEIREDACVAWP
jgi:hypothetical protein